MGGINVVRPDEGEVDENGLLSPADIGRTMAKYATEVVHWRRSA